MSSTPHRYDHDATILDDNESENANGTTDRIRPTAVTPGLTEWLSSFESPQGIGSNSWVIGKQHTRSGAPMMANDPHVPLLAPPVWYEMHLKGPKTHVRGVTLSGIPFPIVGETEHCAWGVTVAYTDGIDFYSYETNDGKYRYGDEYRSFDTETKTVPVADGDDQEVTVKRTVHGPVVDHESDGDELQEPIAVAWTGLTATRTGEGLLNLLRSESLTEAREGLSMFDLPSLNFVYANRDGETLYQVVGKVPIRKTDGEPVAANRVFNGSDKAGEWPGFKPYGTSTWDENGGVIPFEEMPHEINPEYLGTANQRIVEDESFPHYLSASYATPFRGIRLNERLDERVTSGEPIDREFMKSLQRDTHDERAAIFVPKMLAASNEIDGKAAELLEALSDWDYHMDRDSRAALIFSRFIPHYRDVVFKPRLEEALDDRRDPEEYYGDQWVTVTLNPDSDWFPEGRPVAIQKALERTAAELEEEGWETYGDFNTADFKHKLEQDWLAYPPIPTDGAEGSLNNFRRDTAIGSSWRQICPMDKSDGPSEGTFPGGNNGNPMSDHYHDQLKRWADVEYTDIGLKMPDETTVTFTEDEQ
ncbi:penicillin acylase family protein [Halocatena halophila]|uniref:penicillin acylase family protein n=1 Tax=Halocatena halophila TaxID=2814576 RepID=UPI002ED5012D